MNAYLRKPVIICNLLLLVGRPLALIGFVTVLRGVASMAPRREMLLGNGFLLVTSGFIAFLQVRFNVSHFIN